MTDTKTRDTSARDLALSLTAWQRILLREVKDTGQTHAGRLRPGCPAEALWDAGALSLVGRKFVAGPKFKAVCEAARIGAEYFS